jgi:hypothetical protein
MEVNGSIPTSWNGSVPMSGSNKNEEHNGSVFCSVGTKKGEWNGKILVLSKSNCTAVPAFIDGRSACHHAHLHGQLAHERKRSCAREGEQLQRGRAAAKRRRRGEAAKTRGIAPTGGGEERERSAVMETRARGR